jgi:phospholipid transport system substrate-binding protein
MNMANRRAFLLFCCGSLLTLLSRRSLAQTPSDRAVAFVRATGERILAAMRSAGSVDERRKIVGPIIDQTIDVDGVAQFCLGRFWRTATPDQQQRYLKLFHEVLIGNITSKLGEYQEVKLTVGRAQTRDDNQVVTTTIERANNPPTTVEWVVANVASNPKVIDVIAEDTSLRITQRSDYASFLSHNNNDIDKLIRAMKDQLAQN